MDPIVIAAIITGGLSFLGIVVTIVVKIYLAQKSEKDESSNINFNIDFKPYTEILVTPPKHPEFLNPDEYEVDSEDYFVTCGAFLQQDRPASDVSVRKINKAD